MCEVKELGQKSWEPYVIETGWPVPRAPPKGSPEGGPGVRTGPGLAKAGWPVTWLLASQGTPWGTPTCLDGELLVSRAI